MGLNGQHMKCSRTSIMRDDDGEPMRDAGGGIMQKPCGNWAMWGLPTCWLHTGRKNRAAVARYRGLVPEARMIGMLLSDVDLPALHPMDGILENVRYSGAMMRMLSVLVAELRQEPVIERNEAGDLAEVTPGLWGLDHNLEQAPHVLVTLYGVWHDKYVKDCKTALDAGIDERLVRNAEATGATLEAAFVKALATIELSDDQRTGLMRAMAREVRSAVALPPSPAS